MQNRYLNKSAPTAKTGWALVRLGDFTTKIGSGSTPRGGEAVYVKKGVPLIRSMNVHFDGLRLEGMAFITKADAQKLKNVTVHDGDVLLNITGASIGRVTTVPGEFVGARVNQHVCIIRPTAALHPKFLAYFFATPVEQMRINQCQVGATRQALTKQLIEDWQVPLPPLHEQQRVVAEIEKQFTRLEAGVAALQRVQANLIRYRAAVLAAASEGRLVPTEGVWEPTTLGEISTVLAGYGFPKHLQGRSTGEIGFFKVGDISEAWKRREKILTRANHYISKADLTELRAKTLPLGTVVFAKIGAAIALNRRAIIGEPSLVDNNVMGVLADSRIQPRYLFHFLCTQKLDELARATTVPSIRKGDVEGIQLKLPPLAEQTRIVAEVERRLSVVEELEAVITTNLDRAKRLRESILTDGFKSERNDDQGPLQPKVKPAPRSKMDKTIRQIISPMKKNLKLIPESLVETVRRNKGRMTPAELCLALHVEEEVEGFFEVLRECRDRGLLVVPSGNDGIIKIAKS